MAKIQIRCYPTPEVYHGNPTGETIYYTDTIRPQPMGAVLGRGYSEAESLKDFVRRAKGDGHDVKLEDLEVVRRTEFESR